MLTDQKTIKIAYLLEYPLDLQGGAQNSTRTLGELLHNREWEGRRFEVLVVCPALLNEKESAYDFPVYTYKMGGKRVSDFLIRRKFFKTILRREKPDIVHIQMPESLITYDLLGKRFRKQLGAKLIFTDRGLYYGYRPHTRPFMRHALKAADSFITTTSYNKKLWEDGAKIHDIEVIPNTVSEAYMKGLGPKNKVPSDQDMLPFDRAHDDRLTIGFAGRICAEKDWPFAVELVRQIAVAKIPCKIKLVLSTFDEKDMETASHIYDEMCALIGKENLEYGLNYDEAKMLAFYDSIDIFVMTSCFESFGKVAIEAMSRGCAVLATAVGGLPEVIGKNENLFSKEDVKQAVEYIGRMQEDRELLQREKQFFYGRYLEHYTPEQGANKHIALYEKLINSRVLIINEVLGTTSTGRICADLAKKYEKEGYEVKVAYGRWSYVPDDCKKYGIRIGTSFDVWMHGIGTRLFDNHGLGSQRATKAFLKWADTYNPDLIWIHNIHGYYLNYPLLFEWLKKREDGQIKWTLHDCFAFTGHCVHYEAAGCNFWKEGCKNCPQKRTYPTSYLLDRATSNYEAKRKAFQGVKNLTLVVPSKWMASQVQQSLLKEYPVEIQPNRIDSKVFRPMETAGITDRGPKNKHNILINQFNIPENKIKILAVSNTWQVPGKGFVDLLALKERLSDEYVLVIVGLNQAMLKRYQKKAALEISRQEHEKETSDVLRKTSNHDITKAYISDQNQNGMAIYPGVENLYQAIMEWKNVCAGQGSPMEQQGFTQKVTDDSNQKRQPKASLICIDKIENPEELAKLYQAADLFVNPTYQDTYPTVNLEAIACETYVITYNGGGCAETLYAGDGL